MIKPLEVIQKLEQFISTLFTNKSSCVFSEVNASVQKSFSIPGQQDLKPIPAIWIRMALDNLERRGVVSRRSGQYFSQISLTAKFADIEELLIRIPNVLSLRGPLTVEEIVEFLNWKGESNQVPEVTTALEELISDGEVKKFGSKYRICV
jgi:hypothetical protein